jgi:hypothetical protein
MRIRAGSKVAPWSNPVSELANPVSELATARSNTVSCRMAQSPECIRKLSQIRAVGIAAVWMVDEVFLSDERTCTSVSVAMCAPCLTSSVEENCNKVGGYVCRVPDKLILRRNIPTVTCSHISVIAHDEAVILQTADIGSRHSRQKI